MLHIIWYCASVVALWGLAALQYFLHLQGQIDNSDEKNSLRLTCSSPSLNVNPLSNTLPEELFLGEKNRPLRKVVYLG